MKSFCLAESLGGSSDWHGPGYLGENGQLNSGFTAPWWKVYVSSMGTWPKRFVIAAGYPWLSEVSIHKLCDRREQMVSKATAMFKNRRYRRY